MYKVEDISKLPIGIQEQIIDKLDLEKLNSVNESLSGSQVNLSSSSGKKKVPLSKEEKEKIKSEKSSARKIIAEEKKRIKKESADAEKKALHDQGFDSKLEYNYYMNNVKPLLDSGELISCDMQKVFILNEKLIYGNCKMIMVDGQEVEKPINMRKNTYTSDFFLTFADGTIKIVETKNHIIRGMQREYPLKRRQFIEQFCIPNNWIFEEYIIGVPYRKKKAKKSKVVKDDKENIDLPFDAKK